MRSPSRLNSSPQETVAQESLLPRFGVMRSAEIPAKAAIQ